MVSNNPNYKLDTEEEEEEDNLSLCDLSISDNTEESLYQNSSSSDQDFFHFFNEKLTPSYPPDEFIFCGKLITYNKPMNLRSQNQSNGKNRGLLRRNSNGFYNLESKKDRKRREFPISMDIEECRGERKDDLVRRSMSSTSREWSRWQLFVFGLANLPAEVELDYTPIRGCRKSSPAMSKLSGGGGKEGGCKRRRGKGLWGLLRDLGCRGTKHV
ncbi:hypothetical protein LguiA_035058 [Lonicera macranthoides]